MVVIFEEDGVQIWSIALLRLEGHRVLLAVTFRPDAWLHFLQSKRLKCSHNWSMTKKTFSDTTMLCIHVFNNLLAEVASFDAITVQHGSEFWSKRPVSEGMFPKKEVVNWLLNAFAHSCLSKWHILTCFNKVHVQYRNILNFGKKLPEFFS